MTYKEIIFSGIEDRLTKEKIKHLLFVYDIPTKKTKAFATHDKTNETLPIPFTKAENVIIKRMLINKIVNQSKKEYPNDILFQIIVNIDNEKKDISIYLQFENKNLIKL